MSKVVISRSDDRQAMPVPWDAFSLHRSQRFEIIQLVLQPGEIMPLHENKVVVLFSVLTGVGELLLENGSHQMSKGCWAEIDANEKRGWQNLSGELLELLVVKLLD